MHAVVGTVEGEGPVGVQEALDHLHRLLEPVDPHLGRVVGDARLLVVGAHPTGTETQLEAPPAQQVERRGLLGQHDRMAVVVPEDQGPHAEGTGGGGHGGQGGDGRELVTEVVGHEEGGVAEGLGTAGLIGPRAGGAPRRRAELGGEAEPAVVCHKSHPAPSGAAGALGPRARSVGCGPVTGGIGGRWCRMDGSRRARGVRGRVRRGPGRDGSGGSMKKSLSRRAAVLAVLALVASGLLAAAGPPARSGAATPRVRPIFSVIHHTVPFGDAAHAILAATPPTWTFSYSYGGTTYRETLLGRSPTGGVTTTVPVVVVPVQLTYGTVVMSPERVLADGETTVQNTLASPLFQQQTYVQGGTDVGTTQYGDAFQRASLWGTVHTHPGYHLLLAAPTVEPLQSLTVPARFGAVVKAFGGTELTAGINWFDGKAVSLLGSLGIPADAVTIFLTAADLPDPGPHRPCRMLHRRLPLGGRHPDLRRGGLHHHPRGIRPGRLRALP